jgi:hypothetical protein
MIKNHVDKRNMPFFDAFRTTAVIGLLMQQTAALHCPEGPQTHSSLYSYQQRSEYRALAVNPEMEESLGFIQELTTMLQRGYSILVNSSDADQDYVIRTLNPAQTDLVELQLRGLEGALKNAYLDCAEADKPLLKPYLIIIAQARSAASKLNNLIAQMTKPVDTFKSSINMDGLRALAYHGTQVMNSGHFH